jgi:hypothetical protein
MEIRVSRPWLSHPIPKTEREVDDSLLHSPDRWDNLPEAVKSLPGLYANTLTFSAGPRVRNPVIMCEYFDKRIAL